MAFTEYELVVLDNGEVALQRAGSNEPLVRINGGKHVQVAKSMVDAGIKTVFDANDDQSSLSVGEDDKRQTLH